MTSFVVFEDLFCHSDFAEQRNELPSLPSQSLNVAPQSPWLSKCLLSNAVPQLLFQNRVLSSPLDFRILGLDQVDRLIERPLHQTLALPLPAHFGPSLSIFKVLELLPLPITILHLQV